MTPTLSEELAGHCRIVSRRLREGRVVPFLGAGANLCGRPTGADWQSGQYLPSGGELAAYLAESYAYPKREAADLLRVSQYIQAVTGGTVLYEELHELFTRHYAPNALHLLLAGIPAAVRRWRDEGHDTPFQLIVTTNYDDALEAAFTGAGEEFDLVTYVAKGTHRGKFMHHRPDGTSQLIEEPNRYRELSLDARTVILKIHGAVDRADASQDSYVITEDNYIEYLAQKDISNLLPATLMAAMSESHFLFLGYSLSDWNLRVILHRIWGELPFEDQFTSWAIQTGPSRLEERLWRRRNVEILDLDLAEYVAELERVCIAPRDSASAP
ncbi:MAG: hypothetical protein QOD69_2752 [Solirubrobacteraceae bacterium]|nr:hypothetical protein [Solirubrobacteraceae bacterium]